MNEMITPPDGGVVYAETNLHNLIAEPYNAASASVFLVIALYWVMRIKTSYHHYLFLGISTIILLIGAVGGTLYHAFRISKIFLVMDWLPILLLCVMAALYFLYQTTGKWWHGLLLLLGFAGAQILMWKFVAAGHRQLSININYALMALLVLLPLALFLVKVRFRHYRYVVLSLLCFTLALLFRIYDHDNWLPVGTHFLWHCFGAIACHQIFLFIYKSKQHEITA
jgi:hypothetical protein